MKLSECTKCSDLVEHRTQVVIPLIRGDAPKVLFLGEAPGKTEDTQGEPFCGPAGKWHWWFTDEIGVSDSCVVGNCINCRPVVMRGNRKVNGKPTVEQLQNCAHWRNMLINSYPFQLVVLYGTYPIKTMLDLWPPVSDHVGKLHHHNNINIPMFACYHPATLVYDEKTYIELWKEHIITVRELINET